MSRILGYCDPLSVAPGETIRFMVSCDGHGAYRADIVRLICADDSPDGPGYKEEVVETALSGDHVGAFQPLHPGSCVVVPVPARDRPMTSFTLQAFIWPTKPAKGKQGIVCRWNESQRAGIGLMIDEDGCAALSIGDGQSDPLMLSSARCLRPRRWYLVAATYDAQSGVARVIQEPLEPLPTIDDQADIRSELGRRKPDVGTLPIVIAACSQDGAGQETALHFNGKIDRPRVARAALDTAAIEVLRRDQVPSRLSHDVVAGWDFALMMTSTTVRDRSPNGLHGTLHNFPTRAVTGHNWTGEVVWWRDAPSQYGAIHFHDDDICDAGWAPSLELKIPQGTRSAMYSARLQAGDDQEYIPFFVRPPRGQATAQIAFLVPTATYMAYANYLSWADNPLIEKLNGGLWIAEDDDLYLNEHRELGASTYDTHADGSGICHASRLRPMLNIRPRRTQLWNLNADSHLTDWLEAEGQAYDVITDEDLHVEGLGLLARYRLIMSGTHPEYYSLEMLNALRDYLNEGGRLMYMGGNGFYWRIAFHPHQAGVIEVRRCNGTRNWVAEPGEHYHAFDGQFGGTWRAQGRAPNRLVGVGFSAEGFDASGGYVRQPDSFDPRAAFVFEGIGADERIGDFGSIGNGAAGLELDRADAALGTPPHALVLASSESHSDNYLVVLEDVPLNYPGLGGSENAMVRADMVLFETPRGGAVFSTGSIAWAGALAHDGYDNNVARITGNVLRRFLDPQPL